MTVLGLLMVMEKGNHSRMTKKVSRQNDISKHTLRKNEGEEGDAYYRYLDIHTLCTTQFV